MRAFIAVLPSEQVIEEIEDFIAPRRDALAARGEWRWTRSEHLHVTLAFLPQVESFREEALIASGMEWAGSWARRHPGPAVRLRLVGAGAFPDPGSARVLWAAVRQEEAPQGQAEVLATWARDLRARASREGIRVQGRRFTPHLTLARSGRPRPAGHLLQALDTLHTSAFTVGDVVLVGSHLGQGPGGTPRYEIRHRWSLE